MYKALRLAAPHVVRFSVHDVPRLHTTSLHRCYRKALPYTEFLDTMVRLIALPSCDVTPVIQNSVRPSSSMTLKGRCSSRCSRFRRHRVESECHVFDLEEKSGIFRHFIAQGPLRADFAEGGRIFETFA